jgi:hypothetical protein
MDRDDLIAEEFVSHAEATTGSGGYETAEDTGTTENTSSLRRVMQWRIQPTRSKLHLYTLETTVTLH